MPSSVLIAPAKWSAMDFIIARSGDSFCSSHFHDVNTFSERFPDRELCHTIEKTKSFSNNSQKAGAFGRVSFDPNGNTFGEDIRTYINQNSTAAKSLASVSKKPDCRRARRITYEVLDGRLNLSPKPERMRELAKNLWKLQTLKHCIKEKTINHLISAFPELDDLIKENKNIKSPILVLHGRKDKIVIETYNLYLTGP